MGFLLLATILLYWTILPFCFYPGTFVCMFRSDSPAVTYTVAASLLLSRSFLLATADSDGLPGHASGCLQIVLFALMLCVEGGMLLVGEIQRKDNFSDLEIL